MSKDKKRMAEIQERLVQHIQTDLHTDKDFLYMATMLMKHSIVLYKTFLEDDQIKEMLGHVKNNLTDEIDIEDYTHTASKDDGQTYH